MFQLHYFLEGLNTIQNFAFGKQRTLSPIVLIIVFLYGANSDFVSYVDFKCTVMQRLLQK